MSFAPSDRAAVAPFHVMRVLAAAARRAETGAPVFDLTAGQPSTPAPAPVLAAARRALEDQVLGYTEAPGIVPLRTAIAGHYRHRYGLEVDPSQVYVTTGSSGAFLLAFLSAFDVGDRVGLARPGYPAYRNILQALGCQVIDLPCGPETRYQPTIDMIVDLDLDGLVVASPANPTGTMLDPAELAALAGHCAAQGIRLISDEIYHGIDYTGQPSCSWSTDRSGFVINSFSKYFSMTGWRIGWMLVPDDLADPVDALAGNMAICPPALAQYAAVSAFDAYDECDGHVARYAVNRGLLLDGLRALGITELAPADGAFYVYANVAHLTDDTQTFCGRLLDETGVAVAPGIDFDQIDGPRSLRMSFAGATSTITGGLHALGEFLHRG
ncbi:aminotransferase class I/II-fold pyridoxal phosphate-dependent enzyme [Nakamurella sp. PAMC28650]|uniref:aminotransferase class I/II-fold pyridoxal phosphate-dependent enzyme n=1 Tax=Nakamurella sp. PAMC28650 TaxID=2762325 RepID=UPI00164E2A91|nr:aminotransferase class I/II-fold pyridoxal phosphate-dependent enzyme [Nakamurella sp. PAMC28650]QNK81410.1 aminotransferase class I/II-fold pyridoxal phosphate-dependent enzyme [Nakamurella sp. PAMC28650]